MPGLDDDGWRSSVVPALQRDAAFTQAPTWAGQAVETGALSRLREQRQVAGLIERDGHSAATRIAARLVELAWLLDALRGPVGDTSHWVRAWSLGAGIGLAAVQTARGLLMHCARVGDDRVDDYRIVAPTEWNFHPDGALAHGLVGTEAEDEATLTARAGLAVLALDPCVGFAVEVTRHA
jgi:Ni,Fe-hydrogenase I large subunit